MLLRQCDLQCVNGSASASMTAHLFSSAIYSVSTAVRVRQRQPVFSPINQFLTRCSTACRSASVWVARRLPGYAFIEFDDCRDALDAIRELDGKNGWRMELSHNSSGRGRGRGGRGGDDTKCYECGEPGHFARECRLHIS